MGFSAGNRLEGARMFVVVVQDPGCYELDPLSTHPAASNPVCFGQVMHETIIWSVRHQGGQQ